MYCNIIRLTIAPWAADSVQHIPRKVYVFCTAVALPSPQGEGVLPASPPFLNELKYLFFHARYCVHHYAQRGAPSRYGYTILNRGILGWRANNQGGGGSRKKLPHRLNDLPYRPLVLCSNLPNDHGHFDEELLEFQIKFREKITILP